MSVDPARTTAAGAHAVLDTEGRLISAEPRLDALNRRAGGDVGLPLVRLPGRVALAVGEEGDERPPHRDKPRFHAFAAATLAAII